MKSKTLISLVIFSFLFVSCKKQGDESSENTVEKNIKQNFYVEVDASCVKSDDFTLYYTEDGTTLFNSENAVWKGIKGGKKMEKVTFELPEEKIPTDIRLDFGLKEAQDSVVVKNVKVNCYGNSFEIVGSDFFKYFVENKQFNAKIDAANGTLIILQKDGKYTTPYYYPTQLTIDNIKKITTSKE